MKKLIFSLLFVGIAAFSYAQDKYMTRNGSVDFIAEGAVKDGVQAKNNQAACVLDGTNGEVVFQVLIKSFQFEKALMQEHFNENYMESHKFPKAVLKGKVNEWKTIDLSKNGSYTVTVTGDLTIRGITKKVTEKGKLEVKDGKIILGSGFTVLLADYNIAIPKIVEDKVAKEAKVTLAMSLEKTR